MHHKEIIVLWLTFNLLYTSVTGYSTGAPTGTCFTRFPKHKTAAQALAPPYDIYLHPSKYHPGDIITVTITSKTDISFKGIQMAAFRASGNGDEVLGYFTQFPEDKIKAFTCVGSFKNNMITHKNDKILSNLTMKWVAPNENVGDIIFKTTLIQSYDTFWVDIKSNLSAIDQSNIVFSSYKTIHTTPLISDINFSLCGDTKGCFLYPAICSGNDCMAAVTFQYDPDSDSFVFELMSNTQQDYVALGFSGDFLMGDDEVVICLNYKGHLNIEHGWNPSYHYERQIKMFISNAEIREADGRLQCRFVLPKIGAIYKVNQESDVLEYFNRTFDHTDEWYLQLAWGRVIPSSDVISKHEEMPPVSYQKINLKDKEIFRGSSYGYLVQAHASLMIVAWTFITGIVTVISRHYRDWMPRTRWFGTKVWFQVHRALGGSVLFLTALALTFVFTQFGIQIRKSSIPHSYLGLTVISLLIVQIIFGLLRPGPDEKLRVYFNWGHQILGQIIHLLAAVTMYFGFNMIQTIKNAKSFGITVLSVWVIGQVAWHIIFEIFKFKGKRQQSSSINGDADKDKRDKISKSLTVILATYIVFLFTVCIAAMTAVFIY